MGDGPSHGRASEDILAALGGPAAGPPPPAARHAALHVVPAVDEPADTPEATSEADAGDDNSRQARRRARAEVGSVSAPSLRETRRAREERRAPGHRDAQVRELRYAGQPTPSINEADIPRRTVPPRQRANAIATLEQERAWHDVTFPVRRGAQRIAALVMIIAIVATGGAGWFAYDQMSIAWTGVSVIFGVVALITMFVRSSPPVGVEIKKGMLILSKGSARRVWDLDPEFSPVAHIHGRPGRPGWRIMLRDLDPASPIPAQVDGTMVKGKDFTEALRLHKVDI